MRRPAPGSAPGLVLITPRPAVLTSGEQYAAMIVTNAGRIVWYSRRPDRVHNLQTIRYRGQTLLALYQCHGFRRGGHYELLDRHYQRVGTIHMGRGYSTDSHELQVTPRGDAYVDSYHVVHVPGIGKVDDWVMREINIATHKVLFEWHALRHVPLSASYRPPPSNGTTWDFFHGNSIDPPARGGHTIIVSSRNTSAVYGIDRRNGKVLWILGGKRDQFGLMRNHPGWRFCGQHDARRQPNGDITVFDNGGNGTHDGTGCGIHAARVPRFHLDVARHTVRLVGDITSIASSPDGLGLYPTAVGSARRQANGDTLIDWGTTGYISQVTRLGGIRFEMQIEPWTYRAVRANWLGHPLGHPKVLARRNSKRSVTVWASWNGATQIHDWQVLAGPRPNVLRAIGERFRFADLETRMSVRTSAPYVAVRALSATRRQLGVSATIRVR